MIYCRKGILESPRSPFLGKRRMQPFVHLSIVFCLYTALQNRSSKSSNFFVIHTSRGTLSRLAAFLLLIFVSTTLSSSSVNYTSWMSSWLFIIFGIGLSVTLWEFPSRFLKYYFPIYICSWLAIFSFTLEVLFLLLALFTVCHAISDCISLPSFLFN